MARKHDPATAAARKAAAEARRSKAAVKKAMKAVPESKVQADIIKAGAMCGIRLEHHDAGAVRKATRGQFGGRFGTPKKGTLDLHGTVPCTGRRVAIEVKRLGEKPTPEQIEEMHRLVSEGVAVNWFDNAKDALIWLTELVQIEKEKARRLSQ